MAWLPLSTTGRPWLIISQPRVGVGGEWRTRHPPASRAFLLLQHISQPSTCPSRHPQDVSEATTPSVPVPRAFSCNQGSEGKIGERAWWFGIWMRRRFLGVSCPRQPDRAQGQDTSTLSPSPRLPHPLRRRKEPRSALGLSPAGLPQSLGAEGEQRPRRVTAIRRPCVRAPGLPLEQHELRPAPGPSCPSAP